MDISEILNLVGTRVRVLHAPHGTTEAGTVGGGDIDCMVTDLDRLWPMRLPPGWQLCQCLQYDITGWSWILNSENGIVAVDTLDDDEGVGRYGFRTSVLRSLNGAGGGVDAAYLVAKRIRKRILDPSDWSQITRLARNDSTAFRAALENTFGRRTAARLTTTVEAGNPPNENLASMARRIQSLRRIRTPKRALSVLARGSARVWRRSTRPSGLYVVLTGPDGTGKSTAADTLLRSTRGFFRRTYRAHWRPGILPRPGAVVGREERDPTTPHASDPRGAFASTLFLFYYWLDFLIGSWLVIVPRRVRTTLVLFERGWWDIAIDPRRYRLNVPSALVSTLGRLLPRPDVILTLETDAATLLQRKNEISGEEIARQTRAWRELSSRLDRISFVDASGDAEDVARRLHQEIARLLEERAMRRLGTGWAAFPSRKNPRWVLPRGPRRVAAQSVNLYQPVTTGGRAGWEIGRLAARLGAFRLLPRTSAPPASARNLVQEWLGPGDRTAMARANHPERAVLKIISERRTSGLVAKISMKGSSKALAREVEAIEKATPFLRPPLSTPKLIGHRDGVIVFDAAPWTPRRKPWRLPVEVAGGLGSFYRAAGGTETAGPAHGDFAPWNLLRFGDSWTVIDWEHFRDDAFPFYDLWHYVVQGHALLDRPSETAIVGALSGNGELGAALDAYSSAAEVSRELAASYLHRYLTFTKGRMNLERADGRAGLEARQRLLNRLSVQP